ncbi:MAG TPA: putative manganese-dependent inorganic diphosphatase [Firmicutes bacterium]|nr:putative manganese-dependent inorganic diphosphatase [Bacillota bacterium]
MKTFVIGHKNPDTDSVTAAISLSYLKNQLGYDTEPRVLGEINKESKYVLDYFKIKHPKILNDVKVQIKDVPFRRDIMVNENDSIYEAYTYMVDNGITGIPVVRDKKKFAGYVSLKEIATDSIRGDFDYLNASYDNILKVLEGREILRFDEDLKGTIIAATFGSEMFVSEMTIDRDTIVIVGSRKSVLDYCINKNARLIILVGNHQLNEKEYEEAKKNKVNIIMTGKHSFEVSKLIGLSNYIKGIVRNETPVTFDMNDYLTDFFEVSNKLKHTNYPIVDKRGNCNGLLRLLDVNSYDRKKVILVDHNEVKQSVDGLNEAVILEIVDHHALGSLTTTAPISFRNMILGSSNSIIYHLYKEAGVKIPKDIAGLMLAGILSDTLILKSPTATDTDKQIVEDLAKIAGIDYEKFGLDMLKAGSSLKDLTIDEIVFYDYKEFEANDMSFGIGQVLTLDYEEVLSKKDEFITFLDNTCKIKGFKLIALFITDIINNGSYVLYSSNAEKILALAYDKKDMCEGYYLPGVISRKKQMVPKIMGELENMD